MTYYGYYLVDSEQRVLYIGQTKDLASTEYRHREDKTFKELLPQVRFSTEQESLNWEASKLAEFRRIFGRNPKYNKTLNG